MNNELFQQIKKESKKFNITSASAIREFNLESRKLIQKEIESRKKAQKLANLQAEQRANDKPVTMIQAEPYTSANSYAIPRRP